MRLSDNTILVAGGTSGIGRALAEQLCLRGNQVIIAGRRQAVLVTTSGSAFVPNAMYPTCSASKAFLPSRLQSLRSQLRKTSVEVLELIPPYTQTELSGPAQATDPRAIPLEKVIADVLRLLGESTSEIIVDDVRSRAGQNGPALRRALREAECGNRLTQARHRSHGRRSNGAFRVG